MLRTIDLNADIGEAEDADGIAAELAILDCVTSANIACGGHRGDDVSMRRTVRAAKAKGVAVGAHPSYPDRANFGRASHALGIDIKVDDLVDTLMAQIVALSEIAADEGVRLAYVKPHGALYTDAVTSKAHADLIVGVVIGLDPDLAFMGGPNSEMERSAKAAGLRFIREGFIDRQYTDDGHLQSRAIAGAVIKAQAQRMAQAKALASSGTVTSVTGQRLLIQPESLCLHGDSAGAVETARQARAVIEASGITVASFIHD